MTELLTIQQGLACPKGQKNEFGGYKYRSCEDILNALKPLLKETGTTVVLSDHLECPTPEWVFVVATASLLKDGKVIASTTSVARHEPQRKGMDASQISGCASSYARKYALNGLFAIDDTKDADALNLHGHEEPSKPEDPRGTLNTHRKTADATDFARIKEARTNAGISADRIVEMCKESPFCVDTPQELLKLHVNALIDRINTQGLPE